MHGNPLSLISEIDLRMAYFVCVNVCPLKLYRIFYWSFDNIDIEEKNVVKID